MRKLLTLTLAAGLVAVGCAKTTADDAKQVEATVRASVAAESAQNGKAFVALWTDKGLKEFDSGTREEIASGKSEDFGSDHIQLVKLEPAKITGKTATVTIEASP